MSLSRKSIVTFLVVGLVALASLGLGVAVFASDDGELKGVKSANKKFRETAAAEAAGWVLVPTLDHCFENPGVGAMGFHYINTTMLDLELDEDTPEALVYEPLANGQRKLAAVEWIVPAGPWDEAGNTAPPELHGQQLHLNSALGVYVLHAWIFRNNPEGTFEDWNPKVSCP